MKSKSQGFKPGKSGNPKTQFKPGKSGNPKGRPPNIKYFGETLRELMQAQDMQVSWTVNGKTKTLLVKSDRDMKYGCAAVLIMEALKGNVQAVKEIADRTDGKALQHIDHNIEQHVVNLIVPDNERDNKPE